MRRHFLHHFSTKSMAISLRIRKNGTGHRNQRLLIIPRILTKLIEVRNVSALFLIHRPLNPEGQ